MKLEVKDKIEEESTKHSTSIGLYGVLTEGVKYLSFKMGAEFGYNLAQEEYAAQSKGMRWGSEDKPDLAHEALERNYPEREGAFGSTWTDGYMQCMRDIENGDLKSQSTQEGGTVGELLDRIVVLPDHVKEDVLKAMSIVSATDKARIEELEKENANLKTVMIAAAEEIQEHWAAHCDEEGYGPVNLMHRLEKGIPSEYGYTAGRFDELKKEVERVGIMLVKAMGEVNDRDLEVERLRG